MIKENTEELCKNSLTVKNYVDQLSKQTGHIINEQDLIKWFKVHKYLIPSKDCKPYKKYVQRKWFTSTLHIKRNGNSRYMNEEMLITRKAQGKIAKLYLAEKA